MKERTELKQNGQQVTEPGRKSRVPLGIIRYRLLAGRIPGHVCRWINDSPGRISAALDGGWEFVREGETTVGIGPGIEAGSTDSRISRVVSGDGLKAYLMKIPESLYEEDQKEKRKVLEAVERDLLRGRDAYGSPGQDGRYLPGENIIERRS